MTLKRLYLIGVLIPGLIAVIATTVSAKIDNEQYKNEWLSKDAITGMTMLVSLIHASIISILSLPMFLNKKKQTNLIIFLSWFFLPLTWIIITVYKTVDHRLNYAVVTKGQLFHLVPLNLPFIIGLTLTYLIFLRQKNYS